MKHRLVCILTTGLFLAVPAYVHAAEKLTIPQIQGSTHISPHARSTAIIEGVVTYIFGNNFIVRHEAGDGNDATSLEACLQIAIGQSSCWEISTRFGTRRHCSC